MNKRLVAIFSSLLLLAACGTEEPTLSKFTDYGYLPGNLGINEQTAPFQSAAYYNDTVYVATTDGVWKLDMNKKLWTRAGFAGKNISLIYHHPITENIFYVGTISDGTLDDKTFFISTNYGHTWEAASTPIFNNTGQHYETYYSLVANPYGGLYANLSGTTIAVSSSTDGKNWERADHATESQPGPPSVIAIRPDNKALLQGAVSPESESWLGQYEFDNEDKAVIKSFTKLYTSENWSNRQPTDITTLPFDEHNRYVGQKGALMKIEFFDGVTGNTYFRSDREEEFGAGYSDLYVRGTWFDPSNPDHVVFGGRATPGKPTLFFYDKTVAAGGQSASISIGPFTEKFDLADPEVIEIIPGYQDPDHFAIIVLRDRATWKMKVVTYKP